VVANVSRSNATADISLTRDICCSGCSDACGGSLAVGSRGPVPAASGSGPGTD
jgi:hypothetical protein